MCGIAGSVTWNGTPPADSDRMAAALDAMQARGPDGSGGWHDAQCRFGHLRLAVIDLSTHASQPMQSDCGRYVIVFNGEIYNFAALRADIGSAYAWRSQSDTEVILAAYVRWGAACLERLRGMFAFAIWDRQEKRLFVARDRLGVKPLYFHADQGVFAFASRPRALYRLLPALSRRFDRQAIRYFLEAGYIPAPYSCHEAIRKLEPGHYMVVDAAGARAQRYWSLDAIAPDPHDRRSEQELIEQLDRLIDESVRLRMVSNVPVGAFLSGGIDSSLVAAYMRKHASGPVKTFTVSFEDPEFDESVHAQAVADHLRTEHHCEQMSPADLLALMPTYLAEYDEPFFDYSAFPVMAVSRLARQHVTVSLSGDGGDEAFGGYHYYRIAQALGRARRLPRVVRSALAGLTGLLPGHKMRLLGAALRSPDEAGTYAFMRSVVKDFTGVMQPALLEQTSSLASLFRSRRAAMPATLSAAEAAMRLDLAFTLPDDYLQKVDVGSMAFSLEAREPLLDHPILEWAAALPLKWKVRGGVNKYLLRQLAYRHVPRAILDRPKMGFGVPMARWLRAELRPWAEQLLDDGAAMDALGLDAHAVRALWRQHQDGTRQAHSCLWSILILLQFYRDFNQSNAHRH